MKPIRPELRDLLVQEAAAVDARRRRRRVALPAAALTGVLIAAIALLDGGSPQNLAPTLLGPQDAVAAVRREVADSDQVLMWNRRSVIQITDRSGRVRREESTQTRWTDLRSGDAYTQTKPIAPGRAPGAPLEVETWTSQSHLVVATTDAGGQRIVQDLPVTSQPDSSNSTVADVREILASAESGALPLTTERLGRSSAAVVTLRRRNDLRLRMWISRTGPPRVLQIQTTTRCGKPARCGRRSTTQTTTTTAWKLLPRAPKELQLLQPPNERPG